MKDFTVASTTDSLEAVQEAAGMAPEKEELETPSETPETPEPTPPPAPDEGQEKSSVGKARQ